MLPPERALVNGDWTFFDLNTVNLLINIFDRDRNCRIGFNKFVCLWKYIEVFTPFYSHPTIKHPTIAHYSWQGHCARFDSDKSGTIDRADVQNALTDFGYIVTPVATQYLAAQIRYSPNPGTSSGITFDRYVHACVVLHQVTKAFKALDSDRDGWIKINYHQYLETFFSFPE
ncbi:hypothetical protein EI94DRAFT_1590293 [Lactarius quietus]|nr:hypothetical protein EI94DRAFT_1590293 [Lactarius quietus]